MATRAKQTVRAWVWPEYPARDFERPSNLHVDTSIVAPGRYGVIRNGGDPNQKGRCRIDDVERSERPAGPTYYRPNQRELRIVKTLLGGEPGDADWGRLVNMVLYHTTTSVGDVRNMNCKEIVAILERGDTSKLREGDAARHKRFDPFSAKMRALGEALPNEIELSPGALDLQALDARLTPDPDNEPPVRKASGWTQPELVEQTANSKASLSDSFFDRIRQAADVKPSISGGRGQQRRYSRTELK